MTLKHAFLPCVISTSGRLHGEFLRLLYIIAHRRTSNWFRRHSKDEPSEEAFKFRRGQYFWHTRAAIGQAAARAVAQRVQVPSKPFAATVFFPTCRTASLSRPPSLLRMCKILRPPSLVLVVLVGVEYTL